MKIPGGVPRWDPWDLHLEVLLREAVSSWRFLCEGLGAIHISNRPLCCEAWGEHDYFEESALRRLIVQPEDKEDCGRQSSYGKAEVDVCVVCFVADMVVVIRFGAEASKLWVLISFWKMSETKLWSRYWSQECPDCHANLTWILVSLTSGRGPRFT